MAPIVSVLMPVFNAGRYLSAAVESILNQSFKNWALVAVNDGSTDDSLEILNSYSHRDPRITVLSRPNTGIVGALNDGLALCSGQYVARMDADDISMPQRLEIQIYHMEQHPECVALGAWVTFIDPQGWKLFRWEMPCTHEAIMADLLAGGMSGLVHPVVMFRADALRRAGAYRQAFQWVEDVDLYTRLVDLGKLQIIPEHLLLYRQHAQSVNQTRQTSEREKKRIETINAFRATNGLPHLASNTQLFGASRDEMRQGWIRWACQSGFPASAWKHLLALFGAHPFRPEPWRLTRRVLSTTLRSAFR